MQFSTVVFLVAINCAENKHPFEVKFRDDKEIFITTKEERCANAVSIQKPFRDLPYNGLKPPLLKQSDLILEAYVIT